MTVSPEMGVEYSAAAEMMLEVVLWTGSSIVLEYWEDNMASQQSSSSLG